MNLSQKLAENPYGVLRDSTITGLEPKQTTMWWCGTDLWTFDGTSPSIKHGTEATLRGNVLGKLEGGMIEFHKRPRTIQFYLGQKGWQVQIDSAVYGFYVNWFEHQAFAIDILDNVPADIGLTLPRYCPEDSHVIITVGIVGDVHAVLENKNLVDYEWADCTSFKLREDHPFIERVELRMETEGRIENA